MSIPTELGGLPRNTSVLLTAIAEARAVKTPAEIRLLQLATTVGGVAHKRVMRDAQHKSAYEYEVEAQFVLANSLCGLDRQVRILKQPKQKKKVPLTLPPSTKGVHADCRQRAALGHPALQRQPAAHRQQLGAH